MKNSNKDTGAAKWRLSLKLLQYHPHLLGMDVTLLSKSLSAKKQNRVLLTAGSGTP